MAILPELEHERLSEHPRGGHPLPPVHKGRCLVHDHDPDRPWFDPALRRLAYRSTVFGSVFVLTW